MSSLPEVGSAFPPPPPKAAPTPAPAPISNKFAAFVGNYDGGEMGVLLVRQEGEKLFALAPGGERIELVPDTTADKFSAQPVGGTVTFERGPEGKVTALS